MSKVIRSDLFSDNFKTNAVTVTFLLPLDKSTASKTALLCGVLKCGNTVFGERDKVNAYLEKNYGAAFDITTSKTGEIQHLSFSANYLDDKYSIDGEPVAKNVIKLLRSVIFCPMTENNGFMSSFTEQEKHNQTDRIKSLINDKRIYSLEKCKQIMFENEKYGVYEQGDIDETEKITPVSLYEFYKKIISDSTVVITYVGSKTDTGELLKPITDSFADTDCAIPKTRVNNTVTKVKNVTEEMNVSQSKLNMGFRLGESALKDEFALRMFSVIYGSSPTSKLFMNVREKMSLCYYCSCATDSLKNVMFVYSGIETEDFEKARDEILNQLELMKSGEFTDEEFDNARAYLTDSYKQAFDSNYALSTVELSGIIHGDRMSINEQIEKVMAVTRDDVIKIAKDISLDTVFLLKGIGGAENDN